MTILERVERAHRTLRTAAIVAAVLSGAAGALVILLLSATADAFVSLPASARALVPLVALIAGAVIAIRRLRRAGVRSSAGSAALWIESRFPSLRYALVTAVDPRYAGRVPEIERPDYLLIDLDPSADGQWPYVREIALVVRDVMDELGLASFPKTSGATGLHVLAPIRPELPFPEVRRFAKALAEEVERRIGDQRVATTTWRVAERKGVFVDFGQNARDRTIASAYSVRPTPDARVSAPLHWDEVATVEPEAFTIETMAARIAAAGDPMHGMWRRAASLAPRFAKLGL